MSDWQELKQNLNQAESLGTDVALAINDLWQQAETLQETFGHVSPQLSNSMLVGAAAAQVEHVTILLQQLRGQGNEMAISLINVNHYYL